MPTDEAYEAAMRGARQQYTRRGGLVISVPVGEHYVDEYARAAVAAVWDLAVAEGRRQGWAEAIGELRGDDDYAPAVDLLVAAFPYEELGSIAAGETP